MDEKQLLQNIKDKPSRELGNLSDKDLKNLLDLTINTIDSVLEDGGEVEIDDFGVFSRRKQNSVSVSFFKPSDRLNDRINRKK